MASVVISIRTRLQYIQNCRQLTYLNRWVHFILNASFVLCRCTVKTIFVVVLYWYCLGVNDNGRDRNSRRACALRTSMEIQYQCYRISSTFVKLTQLQVLHWIIIHCCAVMEWYPFRTKSKLSFQSVRHTTSNDIYINPFILFIVQVFILQVNVINLESLCVIQMVPFLVLQDLCETNNMRTISNLGRIP